MKHLRKVMALVLAAFVALVVATPAFAGSITINPGDSATGTVTTEYTYYELLKASINGDAVSYYLPVSTEGTALKTLLDAVTITKSEQSVDVFTFTQSADKTRWIATLNDAIEESDGEALATALNTAGIKAAALATNTFSPATATTVEDGYYLVTSTLGSKLVLQTIGDVTINTKNEYFTDVKTASKTNMEVGDTVTYTITVHVPETVAVGDEITVHDTLDSHLAIDASTIAAKLGETDVTLSDGTKKAETETFAKKFTVTAAMLGQDVVITYDAELLSTAADDTGYVNTTFANDSAYETVPSEVKVYTFDIDLDKTFTGVEAADAEEYEATFELRTNATDASTAISFISDNTGYVKADSDDTASSKDLTVTGGDSINIRGLEAGTYYLVETATADGFNLLADPITVTITDTTTGTQPNITPSHTVAYSFGEITGNGTVEVTNNSGSELPSTGGMGTTILYTIGGIMLVGGAIALVSKKRVANMEK